MKDCCKDQTTPYCPTCGANLKDCSWSGLKKELERRLKQSQGTLANWKADRGSDEKLYEQGVARNTRNVNLLTYWIKLVSEKIAE